MLDKKLFKNPPKEYAPVPFWFWNSAMKDEEIVFELEEMAKEHIYEVILHARKGLPIAYLSEEWFHRVEIALKTAKRLGMRVWIYDEDNWPSGYASGKVLERDSSFAAKCLTVEKIYPVLGKPVIVPEKKGAELVATIAVYQDKKFIDITDYGRNGKEPWHSETLCWEVFVFRMEDCLHAPAYSDLPYVDLLNLKATDAFMEVTHKEYKKRFPEYWGDVIKGFFTDEPGFYQNYLEQAKNINTIAWTKEFPERLQKAYGYDIRPYLPTLWQDMEASNKTRLDYYNALDRFYRESYFERIRSFLHEDGLLSIGHLHHEDKLQWIVQTEGDFFNVIDGLDYSGIDCIERTCPRVTERLGASAGDLLSKPRTLSETFGCFGWELTPQEMKERTDLQFAQGINMLVPHAFFSSIEGYRKTESPPSLFYQNEYWPGFYQYSDYVARLSYVLSEGKHLPKVALYYPADFAKKRFMPLNHRDVCDVDDCLDRITGALLEKGIDHELVPESFLRNAKVVGNQLLMGEFSFEAVILPCEPDESLVPLLKEFAKKGLLYCFGTKRNQIANHPYFYFDEEEAISDLDSKIDKGFVGENVLSYYREGKNETSLFLVNRLSKENKISLFIPEGKGVEKWNLESGETSLLLEKGHARYEMLSLAPNESLLLSFSKDYEEEREEQLSYEKMPLSLKEALFDGKKYSCSSAHKNDIHGFSGVVSLNFSLNLPKKPSKAILCFENIRDFVSLSINGKEVGMKLWAPFEFDGTSFLKEGENSIALRVYPVKANLFDNKDFDVGLIGDAFAKAF